MSPGVTMGGVGDHDQLRVIIGQVLSMVPRTTRRAYAEKVSAAYDPAIREMSAQARRERQAILHSRGEAAVTCRAPPGAGAGGLLGVAVETLGEMLDLSWRVHARCAWGNRDGMKSIRRCAFRCELDVQTLVLTRGRAFPMGDLASRLRRPRADRGRCRWHFRRRPTPSSRLRSSLHRGVSSFRSAGWTMD